MPAFPGPASFAAFAGVKFAGYTVAGVALRKLYPAIRTGAVKIAAVRTGLGIVAGPVFFIGIAALAQYISPRANPGDLAAYLTLLGLRILIWSALIWFLIRKTSEPRVYLLVNAAAGALWSSLLDVPALALAYVAPWKIPVC